MIPTEFVLRAPRLPLRAPIALRRSAVVTWVQGRTVNLSHSGVLCALPVAVDMPGEVEFVINLSRGALGGPGVPLLPDLHCRGRVVRSEPGAEGERIVAVRIHRQSIRKAQSFLVTT